MPLLGPSSLSFDDKHRAPSFLIPVRESRCLRDAGGRPISTGDNLPWTDHESAWRRNRGGGGRPDLLPFPPAACARWLQLIQQVTTMSCSRGSVRITATDVSTVITQLQWLKYGLVRPDTTRLLDITLRAPVHGVETCMSKAISQPRLFIHARHTNIIRKRIKH